MPLRRRRERREPELPTDSVSDIAFLLIIFFILTTTLARLKGFSAELPSASPATSAAKAPKTPAVQLADGRILFDEQEVTLPVLQERLKNFGLAAKQGEERVVTLEAAGKVPYQDYFAAMAAIRAAGGVVALVQED
jgi:biopolymer transport protein ExbD